MRCALIGIAFALAGAPAAAQDAELLMKETGRCLGLGMAMIANALDPERIFIGGEITAAWDLILPEVQAALLERALTKTSIPIIPEQISGYPRLRGATALVTALFAAPKIA